MYLPEHERAFARPELPPPRLRRLLSAIATGYRAWRNRRAVTGLLDLDDRMLRDIGLSRSDVTSALAGRRREDPSLRLAAAAGERRAARLAAGHEAWERLGPEARVRLG